MQLGLNKGDEKPKGIVPAGSRVPIRLAQPYFGDIESVLADLRTVLETGQLMEGQFIHRFEEEFRLRVGTAHAISVNSCTTALEIILRYLDVRGKEVIVPTNTFLATANAVLYGGGTPILADISPTSLCLASEEILKRMTQRTRAVVLVHIAGLITPELEDIREICLKHDLVLVEDCAHAHGASRRKQAAGGLAAAGAFSFYPTKIITTGTGGMITTDDDALAAFARSVRIHGRGSSLADIVNLGNDWFMDEMSAVLGYHQITRIDEIVERRNQIARRYLKLLAGVPSITFLPVPDDTHHSYYKLPVILDKGIDIASLKRRCQEQYGVELESLYYPPCHLQPVYRRLFGFGKGIFPVAEDILARQICLPVHMGIEESDIGYVANILANELCGA